MIPAFKHPESMAAMSELNGSNVVKKSKFPKEVVEDWIRFDEAYFSIKGKHKFIFED